MIKIKSFAFMFFLIIILSVPVFSLSSTSVSFKSADGIIANFENLSEFQFTKVSMFSVLPKESSVKGRGTIQLKIITTSGERLVLNLKILETKILEFTGKKVRVNSKASGSYYRKIFKKPHKIDIENITYEYNSNTRMINLSASGDVNFEIVDFKTIAIQRNPELNFI